MRTIEQALAWYAAQAKKPANPIWINACDGLTARAYGLGYSGETTAQAHWNNIPNSRKVSTRDVTAAPRGYLVFWSNGAAGHVGTSVGDGTFFTNDYLGQGTVGRVKIDLITSNWHMTPLGYAPPYFPHGGGTNAIPPTNPNPADAPAPGSIVSGGPGATPVLAGGENANGEAITVDTGVDDTPNPFGNFGEIEYWKRFLLGLLGAGLLYLSYLVIAKGSVSSVLGGKMSSLKPNLGSANA